MKPNLILIALGVVAGMFIISSLPEKNNLSGVKKVIPKSRYRIGQKITYQSIYGEYFESKIQYKMYDDQEDIMDWRYSLENGDDILEWQIQ